MPRPRSRGTLEEAWAEIVRLRADLTRAKATRGLLAHAGTFSCPASAQDLEVGDIPFRARAVAFDAFPTAAATNALHLSTGFAAETLDGITNFSNSIRGAAPDTMSRFPSAVFCIWLGDASNSPLVRAAVRSFDESGFTLDFDNSNSAFSVNYVALG